MFLPTVVIRRQIVAMFFQPNVCCFAWPRHHVFAVRVVGSMIQLPMVCLTHRGPNYIQVAHLQITAIFLKLPSHVSGMRCVFAQNHESDRDALILPLLPSIVRSMSKHALYSIWLTCEDGPDWLQFFLRARGKTLCSLIMSEPSRL